jgi:hypothetical protein
MSDREPTTIGLPADEVMRRHVQIAAPQVIGTAGLEVIKRPGSTHSPN